MLWIAALLALASAAQQSDASCHFYVFQTEMGDAYFISDEAVSSISTAQEYCEDHGGTLASIDNENQYRYIIDKLSSIESVSEHEPILINGVPIVNKWYIPIPLSVQESIFTEVTSQTSDATPTEQHVAVIQKGQSKLREWNLETEPLRVLCQAGH